MLKKECVDMVEEQCACCDGGGTVYCDGGGTVQNI